MYRATWGIAVIAMQYRAIWATEQEKPRPQDSSGMCRLRLTTSVPTISRECCQVHCAESQSRNKAVVVNIRALCFESLKHLNRNLNVEIAEHQQTQEDGFFRDMMCQKS